MIKLLKTLSVLTLASGLGLCVPQRALANEDDPPGRAARLGYTHGSVSFQPAGTEDWVAAVVNRPITTGDRLWTDKGARAELHTGPAAIRLGGETGFSFLNLTDTIAQIQLSEGILSIHLRNLDPDETVEVDTPNLAFSLLRPGDYRLEVNETGDTTVVLVRNGEGEVTGGGQAFTVHSNQQARFTGTDQLTADLDRVGDFDEFDRWCRDRDNREAHAASLHYVSPDVVGYEDLDDHGRWRVVPDYGPVWVPMGVAVGWAPYRYGHWVWISPWGWTWVDDAPWGFAPFHYGRWVYVGGGWGWCPGPVAVVRPVYAPALVAWVGGPHFGVGVGIGPGVAWFPLGPREVYVPPYRVSRTYVTNVNVTNTTVNNTYVTNVYNNYTTNNTSLTNIKYVNRSAPGAVTATSQTAFATGQSVHSNMVRIDERQVVQAQISANAGVVPQQRSVLGVASPTTVKPPLSVQTRTVVAKTAPPPAPVAFARQEQAIKSNGGRPLGRQDMQRLETQRTQAVAAVRVAKPATTPVPIEAAARTNRGQSGQPSRPMAAPQATPNQPAQQVPQTPHIRTDRPPSAQPIQSTHTTAIEQQQQQKLQQLQQQQEQQNQKLEQKHQQQMEKAQIQAENQRQQQEHQKLQQKQAQEVQKLEQKQRQERQKAQQQEAKQRQKQQRGEPRQDRPPEK